MVIGAGYIGLEMAENLNHRGVRVDIVERADQILPRWTGGLHSVEQHLRGRGIAVHLSTTAAAFKPLADDRVGVELNNGTTIPADLVVLAAGVRPDTTLASAAGLALGEHGGIAVDTHMRTSDPTFGRPGTRWKPESGAAGQLPEPSGRAGQPAGAGGRRTSAAGRPNTGPPRHLDRQSLRDGGRRHWGPPSVNSKPRASTTAQFTSTRPVTPATTREQGDDAPEGALRPGDGRIFGAQACGFDGIDKRLDPGHGRAPGHDL